MFALGDVTGTTDDTNDSSKEIESLTKQLAKRDDEISSLKEALSEARAEGDDLFAENTAYREVLTAKDKELSEMRASHDADIKSAIDSAFAHVLNNINPRGKEKTSELSALINYARGIGMNVFVTRFLGIHISPKDAIHQLNNLISEALALLVQSYGLAEEIATLKGKKLSVEEEVAPKIAPKEVVRDLKPKKSSEMDKLSEQLKRSEAACAKSDAECLRLRSTVVELQEQIAALKVNVKTATDALRVKALSERTVDKSGDMVSQLKRERQIVDQHLSSARKAETGLKAELTAARAKSAELEAALEKATDEKDKALAANVALQAGLDKGRAQVSSAEKLLETNHIDSAFNDLELERLRAIIAGQEMQIRGLEYLRAIIAEKDATIENLNNALSKTPVQPLRYALWLTPYSVMSKGVLSKPSRSDSDSSSTSTLA